MSRGATARLFAAVDPPPAAREQLTAWAREVSAALRVRGSGGSGTPSAVSGQRGADGAKLRLLAPETMHVTICFLGSRPIEEMQALAAALERCEVPPAGALSLGAPLWLPPRNPRSLALEIGDGDGWLQRLHQSIVETFARTIAWEPDRRRFRAHLTVARVARGKPSRVRRAGGAGRGERGEGSTPGAVLPPTPQLSFRPSAVVLYRSWLDPQGASYEAIAARALAGSSSDSSSSPEKGAGGEGVP
jgi:2'-5' RNA ligase